MIVLYHNQEFTLFSCLFLLPEMLSDNDSYLEEDEQLAKALHESLNVDSPPRHDSGRFFPRFPFVFPTGYRYFTILPSTASRT